MKEEQKYNGSKTRNYFTAYLLASIRGKRLRYLEKQQKILFAEENLEDKEYTDADISPEERLVCHKQNLQNKPVCPPGPFRILKPVMAIRNLQL